MQKSEVAERVMEGSQKDPLRGNGFLVFSRNCLFLLWKEDASVSASAFEGLHLGGKISSCQNPRKAALIKRPLLGRHSIPVPDKSTGATCSLWQPQLPPPGIRGQGPLISENQTQVTSFSENVPAAYRFGFSSFQISQKAIPRWENYYRRNHSAGKFRPYRDDDPMR